MAFRITTYERDAWLENMYKAINKAQFPAGVGEYLYERLCLTANHMVNSIIEGELNMAEELKIVDNASRH